MKKEQEQNRIAKMKEEDAKSRPKMFEKPDVKKKHHKKKQKKRDSTYEYSDVRLLLDPNNVKAD